MKKQSLIIGFILTFITLSSAQAKTDVTGEAYGQAFGTMSMNDASIPYGITIEDINTDENCDNDTQTCLLEGFSWSDVVGWTYWNGTGLQTELGGAGSFPDEYMAKTNYLGSLGGFIWGENYGWLQLSACSGMDSELDCNSKNYCTWTGNNYCRIDKDGILPNASAQTDADWGVYIDFCTLKNNQTACESAESDAYCNWDVADNLCLFDDEVNPNGQPLRGYAWSQHLGWVKFGPEAGNTEFTGAFTHWSADLTPPNISILDPEDPEEPEDPEVPADPDAPALAPNTAWLPNESSAGIINWLEFGNETESQIDLINSIITVNTNTSADFTACPLATPQPNGNVIINQETSGKINLAIPAIGLIGTPPHGFCEYTLGGVIYNQSGLGYYFGPEGLTAATNDGVDPANAKPNVYKAESVTLYVRAGDFKASESSITVNGNGAVADGSELVNVTLSPKDLAGNPIIPVKSGLIPPAVLPEPNPDNWLRDVKLLYDLNLDSDYYFDRVNINRNILNLYPTPIELEGQFYGFGNVLQYPIEGAASLPHVLGNYSFNLAGLAPTTVAGNILVLNDIDFEVADSPLPAVSPSFGPWNTGGLISMSNTPVPGNPLPFTYNLAPALEVTDGQLSTDFITLGQTITANYELINNSDDVLSNYSIDHLLSFSDTGGIGEEVLEIKEINLAGLNDATGRTDPVSAEARYQLFQQDASGTQTQGNNEFHDNTLNHHLPFYAFFAPANNQGVYQADGAYYASPEDECITAGSCSPVNIDRTDVLNLNLLADGGTGSYTFNFTSSQYIGEPITAQVSFNIAQYLAYKADASPFNQFAIYQAQPKISGVDVKSIGLGTSGLVSGDQVFETIGGRDLETLSTASSADLRKEIRQNIAALTRNLEACPTPQTLNTLPIINGGCVAIDELNKTAVALYSGPGTLHLGSGEDVIVPPDYRYTIILTGGADLNIKSNITYGESTNNSFGMMVMEDENGAGGNLYLDPNPTNIVGLLYAEGSILSSPDGGTTFYYGGGAKAGDLKNQLYWQGSLASKNTIGGAPNKILPKNIDCSAWNEDITNCSQAYDLDFIRRFTTLNDAGIDFAPLSYIFSGGGFCTVGTAPNPGCTPGTLPTTVSLMGGSIDVDNSKSLDTFFVERDNRPAPPGFSSGGGLTSSQEVR